MTLVVGAANIAGGFFGMMTLKKISKKDNLKFGVLGQLVGFILLYVGVKISSSLLCSLAVIIFMMGFAMGMGSVVTLYTADVVPAIGVGIATAAQWFGSTIIGKVVPLLIGPIGETGLLLIFVVCCALILEYIHEFCIHTEGLTDDEIRAKI